MVRGRLPLPLLLVWLLFALTPFAAAQAPTERPRFGVRLEIQGPIGPATSDYVHRGMERAAREGAQLILIRMDTPGGLDLAMRDIIRDILNSNIPVVTYVAPNGARAASAGTYILYASHVAAMAPATNLGAATPVKLTGDNPMPRPPEEEPSGKEKKPTDKAPPKAPTGDAMTHKAINDAVAYIRGLAALRGRNADWAEKAVREAASLEAPEALKLGVIDVVAANEEELLRKLDGRTVKVLGEPRVLHTANLPMDAIEPDWRSRLLAVITNPNVAYILMIIGIWGLILEFSNPGTMVAGIAGAICLLLALFAFQALPINYAGMALVLLGIGLMVAEAFAPSFGALGLGGVVAFVIGSIMLIDTQVPGFGISHSLVGAVALFSALLFIVVIHLLLKSHRHPVVTGIEQMVGAIAIVAYDFVGSGQVRIHSELWQARSEVPLTKGQRVKVARMEGLVLHVEPAAEQKGD